MAKKSRSSYVESYIAHSSVKPGASAAAIQSAYKIEVRFLGGLTSAQKNAFKGAADRWTKVIIGDLPSVVVNGEVIDDLLITAQGVDIDGPGGILGQAGPTHLRPAAAGEHAFLPARGIMSFDSADLTRMQENGTLLDVITHEMGHVIGFGTVWKSKEVLAGVGTRNPRFTGTSAKREYGDLKGSKSVAVPIENTGGAGTRESHWRELVFKNELMSGFIAEKSNPISRLTVASLSDLGFAVDLSAAEPFALPNLQLIAEAGLMLAPADVGEPPHALPIFAPAILPDESLDIP